MDDFGAHQSSREVRLRYEEALSQFCLLNRLIETVALIEDLPKLCISIVGTIIEFTAAENCSIMLDDSKTENLNLFVAKGRGDKGSFFGGEELPTTVFAIGEGAAGMAAARREMVCIDDCRSDERFKKLECAAKEVNSMICTPIISAGSVIGVINCSHPKRKQFGEADKRNVALVADHAGILLEKALLIDRFKKQRQEMEGKAVEEDTRLADTEEVLTDLQEQLYRTERFSMLGELLAGVAHELNNRIAPILVYSQMLQQSTNNEKDGKRVRVIEESAMGAKAILETVLSYSRPDEKKQEPVNLNQVMRETLVMTEYKLRNHGIDLCLDLSPEIPPIRVNEKRIAQIFLNIMNNAIHAMEHSGGKLTIRSAYDRDNIKFAFSNSGAGIPAEISGKIFEPFFTTKEPGKGTGLGLSLSRRYAEEHGGRIYLERSTSDETTFIVEIPKPESRAEAGQEKTPSAGCPESTAKVLVVEDDAVIRDVVRDVLGPGYDVEFAADGHDATEKIGNDPFDLLVVDYHMPGFDGKRLYEWINENYPDLKPRIIFSTGDIYREDIRDFIESTGCRCLTKPFSTTDLRNVVSQALRS
jgi:signal transduction histidine kinase